MLDWLLGSSSNRRSESTVRIARPEEFRAPEPLRRYEVQVPYFDPRIAVERKKLPESRLVTTVVVWAPGRAAALARAAERFHDREIVTRRRTRMAPEGPTIVRERDERASPLPDFERP